ncbi:MAG: GUN4 domain-containing protein [Cyanobacteria bacterium SBLK]|nr:GUN4 domain-containing protein [Cyanobacteria bacterium SBLK]
MIVDKGLLNVQSIDNFPCEDLREIDQLWIHYSKGRFGFSVQKRIYQGLGGKGEHIRQKLSNLYDAQRH